MRRIPPSKVAVAYEANGPERLLRGRDAAFDKPEDLIVEGAPLPDRHRRQFPMQGLGQPEAELDKVSPLFLTCLSHGDSLTILIISCQYHHGIDRIRSACYTETVSTRGH